MNSAIEQARKIAELIRSINPDRFDLNTAVRPPADSGVKASSEEQLHVLADISGEKATVTASFKKAVSSATELTADRLLGLIKRLPATAKQMATQFGAEESQAVLMLEQLVSSGGLLAENRDGEIYYFHRD